MRLYLDANIIISCIEGEAPARDPLLKRIGKIETSTESVLLTSLLSRLECRVKPLRDNDAALLNTYECFFSRRRLHVADISATVIERATELRARHGVRTPDAIHLATAWVEQADVFLTGDKSLTRCNEVRVEIV